MYLVNIFFYSLIYSSCNLPTKYGNFRLDIHNFNTLNIPVLYKKSNNNPLVRIHDSCITSEVFNSYRCDCDQQLKLSMKLIDQNGGLIIYLPNEGRGIGLPNKIKTYNIQDKLDLDTYESNKYLNFPEDCRNYNIVPNILKEYNLNSITLLTNSKFKYNKLLNLKINIEKIIPIIIPSNKHNFKYLEAKKKHNYLITKNNINYCSVEEAIDELKQNKPIILVDNEDRENEGDLVFPAETINSEIMAFFLKYTSGLICCAMEYKMVENLKLPLMVPENINNDPHKTAFTISVDYKYNTTTGISAKDRALTCRKLTEESNLKNFNLPGHIFPLRSNINGLKDRKGHTEASIEICRLAGFKPCAVISEITSLDKINMANSNELFYFALENNLKILKINNL